MFNFIDVHVSHVNVSTMLTRDNCTDAGSFRGFIILVFL